MKPTTITMDEALTTRPRAPPRRVFTPTQRTPQPSHYLLLFEDTDSYQIVARSSVKQINDNVVTIIIRNKLVKTKAVCQGSLDECNSEYTRLTRISQTANNQDSDNFSENEKLIIDDSSTENSIHDLSKRLSNASMSPVLTAIHSSRQIPDDDKTSDSDDEETNFFHYRKCHRKNSKEMQVKKKIATQAKSVPEHHSTYLHSSTVQTILINSSQVHQQVQKLCRKVDRLASTTNINRNAIEPYVDKSNEQFPDKLMFGKQNLLDIMATDYGDYARQVLRTIYSSYELQNSILPPGRPHLARSLLEKDRFKLFITAMRYKFKLDSTNFGLFHCSLLRRKLSDFFIEERCRDTRKQIRQTYKQQKHRSSSIDETFD
ncbi:unnamed protein product [Rotaria magnacalcarata]|uniref:Uncharacterized protein n=1 Tax=Rotaria magnacalcarata TaxID=392030 RepID=A0A816U9U7_9BILA|nr:unnamed protein product [Rotaria magnacalcarata]